ncbi:MAG: hypothetical protein V7K48_34715 [Nostoc sp.]|uniref:hypothetical protein n=1 Tax=Nostoc sp. TaxID=1180 RepID=UPI002FFCC943
MSRRKTEKYLKAQLQYAEARKNYTPPTKEPGGSVRQRKSIRVQYVVMSHSGTNTLHYTIRAPLNSLEFFGDSSGEELGLGPSAGDGAGPRGFKPAKIHAVKTNSEGESVKAKDSGRPYTRYTPSAGQSSFSAPICSSEGIPGVTTKVKSIASSAKDKIGAYGRIWFTPEFFVVEE